MTERVFAGTDLFLRLITDDAPEQAAAVAALFREAADGEPELVTNAVTIVELVLVLESYYGVKRDEIRDDVLAILNTPGLEVIGEEVVLGAITRYADEGMEFIDAYHVAWSRRHGIEGAAGNDLLRLLEDLNVGDELLDALDELIEARRME